MIKDRQARAIRPGCKPVAAGVTGLTLQPTAVAGRGKWNLRFVSPETGKRRDMGLGVYPEVSVADALDHAAAARKLIAAGQDPIEARRVRSAVPTFERAARERWEQVAPTFRNAKHRSQWINSLVRHVFPSIGALKVNALTPQHFADALQPIWLETPETASRVKQRCADVMATCWAQGHVQANPLDVVDRLLPKQAHHGEPPHQPAMRWQDVPHFVKEQLGRLSLGGARAALLYLILTAARSGEVRGAMWDEIDFKRRLWTIPAERMKAHRAHQVPLAPAALNLLRRQRAIALPSIGWIFPAARGGLLSDMALTSILRRAKAPSDVPGRVATAHGFRSAFKNWATDRGFNGELSERALAHTIGNKVRVAYERTTQLAARRTMMEQWAKQVIGMTTSTKSRRPRDTAT